MYNSILVGFLAKIWNAFVASYEHSLVKKIANGIKRFFKYIFNGSLVKDFFTKDIRVFEKTRFYSIYSRFVDGFDRMWKSIHKYVNKIKANSIVINTIGGLFKNDSKFVRTTFVFILSFAIGIIINSIFRGIEFGTTYIVSIILVLGSLVFILMGDNAIKTIKNSMIYRFFEYMLSVEEGDEQWW